MKKSILLSIFFLLNTSLCFASTSREELMQKEMDCLTHQKKFGQGVDWQDVCYTYSVQQENIKPSQMGLQQAVSNELDAFDNNSSRSFNIKEQVSREAMLFQDQPPAQVSRAYPIIQNPASTYSNEQPMNNVPVQRTYPQVVQVRTESPEQHKSIAQLINDFSHPKESVGELGTEISYIVYKEPIFNLKDKGNMFGIYGVYTFRPTKEHQIFDIDMLNMYRLDAKFSFGQVDYSSIDGTIKGIPDNMIELRGVAGYDHYFTPTWRGTPYVGLGYRRLNDDSSGKQTESGASGYGRASNYIYMPIGLEIAHQFDSPWRVTGTGEIDWLLWGRQESYLSDVDPALPDLNNNQKRGMGIRGSLEIARIGDRFNFLIEPFVRYWHLSDSDSNVAVGPTGVAISGLEPNNNSTELGIKFGAQF